VGGAEFRQERLKFCFVINHVGGSLANRRAKEKPSRFNRRYEKGRPEGRPFGWDEMSAGLRLGFAGFFRLHDGLFAFDVGLAAFFVFVFVVLFAHKCLYFARVLRFCGATMKVCARGFNTYLVLGVMLASFCGCQSSDKKPNQKQVSALRVHLQANPNDAGATDTVSVLRGDPLAVTVLHVPVLTEANVLAAKVMDSPGGFSIVIQFDESATLMLEQYTAANPGRHLVIFGQWGDKVADGRWLAAELITHRISTGQLAFTPDLDSRAQADRFVLGLNNVSAKVHKGMFK
jgi:hypothetical protein